MSKKVFLFLVVIISACATTSAQEIGRVDSVPGGTQYVTLPVYHDTFRYQRVLTEREEHFLATAPTWVGEFAMRRALREMLMAKVIHVPASQCGNYSQSEAQRYTEMYQVWTGPHKVRVPILRPAPPRPTRVIVQRPAPQAPPVVNITNISYNLSPSVYPSAQMLGPMAPLVVSTSLFGISSVAQYRINTTATGGSATGGAGGVGGASNVNVANTNTNSNANGNTINVGSGSASGTTTASGAGDSTAGN